MLNWISKLYAAPAKSDAHANLLSIPYDCLVRVRGRRKKKSQNIFRPRLNKLHSFTCQKSVVKWETQWVALSKHYSTKQHPYWIACATSIQIFNYAAILISHHWYPQCVGTERFTSIDDSIIRDDLPLVPEIICWRANWLRCKYKWIRINALHDSFSSQTKLIQDCALEGGWWAGLRMIRWSNNTGEVNHPTNHEEKHLNILSPLLVLLNVTSTFRSHIDRNNNGKQLPLFKLTLSFAPINRRVLGNMPRHYQYCVLTIQFRKNSSDKFYNPQNKYQNVWSCFEFWPLLHSPI